jgi:hypothetical protein
LINKLSFPAGNTMEYQFKYKMNRSAYFILSSVQLFFPAKDEPVQYTPGCIKARWTLFKAGTNSISRNQNSVASCLRYRTNTRYAESSIFKWAGMHSVFILKAADFPELKSGDTAK